MGLSVAAIVVSWNSNEILERCIAHLLAQTVSFARILIIDNGSQPPPVLPEGCLAELIALGFNSGFARANNLAVTEVAECDWVALVNPDAFLDENWLEIMLESVARSPNVACFASKLMQDKDRRFLDGLGDAYHFSGLCWRVGHGRAEQGADCTEREVFSACAAAALYRRDAFVEIGGFDESFFCYVEDVDLGFRFRLAGYSTVLVPKARAFHMGSATSGGQRSSFALYHGHRNVVWCYVKNMPTFLFWLFLPAHFLGNLAAICFYVQRGMGGVVCRAKWDAMLGLPMVWRRRRVVQRARRTSIRSIWHVLDKHMFPWC